MYIDLDSGRLLPTLPNSYKFTSNFDFLNDEELKLFNVHRIESFVEDENYVTLREVLGTPYFDAEDVSLEAGDTDPGVGVRVLLDTAHIIDKINIAKGQTGVYKSAAYAISGTKVEEHAPVVVEEKTYAYSDAGSYVFVCLGSSELSIQNPDPDLSGEVQLRYKYVLRRNKLLTMPSVSLGDAVTQPSGFKGVVSHIDAAAQVVKVSSCENVGLLERESPLFFGSTQLQSSDIFSYELYRKALSYGGEAPVFPDGYDAQLAAGSILISVFNTDANLAYNANGAAAVEGDQTEHLIKIESAGDDTDISRARVMNEYGRLV